MREEGPQRSSQGVWYAKQATQALPPYLPITFGLAQVFHRALTVTDLRPHPLASCLPGLDHTTLPISIQGRSEIQDRRPKVGALSEDISQRPGQSDGTRLGL